MERRLAAILAADVVGYSRLMGEDEAGTLARLKSCETDLIEPTVERHGGRIVKRMGDGYLVEFASVVAAVECALAWLTGTEAPIAFRIGIHIGDAMVEQGDLYGDGVNVAARLEALAEPGGLCLSEDAQRQVRGKVDTRWEDAGPQRLKNIAEEMRVFRNLPDAAPIRAGSAPAEWRMPRILLAPFRSLGGDGAALASGLTETLAAALAHFEEFELIDPGAATEAIASQGPAAAGRRLGATYVLEGTLQLAAGKARIGVQLVDATAGGRVWSETLDQDAEDVFALQDDITARVASVMGEAVNEEQARAIASLPDADLDAFQLMQRGIRYLHRANVDDNRVARDYFERVIAQRPDHYFPTLCLGWTYAIEIASGWPASRPDALDYATGLVRGLLRRYDRSAHVHRLMGRLVLLAGDHEQGVAHSERAYRLNPFHSDMSFSYGTALLWDGQIEAAREMLERSFAINPYAPV